MKKLISRHIYSWFFVVCAITFSFSSLVAAEDMQKERAAIKEMIASYSAAYNRHDAKEMASYWATDGDLITVWGQLATNRVEVEQVFAENNATRFKNATIVESIEFIRFVTSEIATVDVDRVITKMIENGKEVPPFYNHGFYVLIKKEGKWCINAYRSYELKYQLQHY